MTFGKRQSVGAMAQAFHVDTAAAGSQVVTAPTPASGSPIRWAIGLLVFGWLLYAFVVSYGPDLWRDHRLAGTWQPAYDLRVTEGKCKRTNFVITSCSANIQSIAEPGKAPIKVEFFMLFSSGGGEALVPVRSTVDRAAVSIFYAAETKLRNRTLCFLASVAMMALFSLGAMLGLWKSLNS